MDFWHAWISTNPLLQVQKPTTQYKGGATLGLFKCITEHSMPTFKRDTNQRSHEMKLTVVIGPVPWVMF